MLARVRRERSDSQTLLDTPGDPAVAAIARRQEGMVSTEQLLAAGLGPGAIKWRVRRGRLVPQHRGVYAVGHAARTRRARLWAAVPACGGPEAAAISHSAFAGRRAPGPPHTGARSGTGQSRCRPPGHPPRAGRAHARPARLAPTAPT